MITSTEFVLFFAFCLMSAYAFKLRHDMKMMKLFMQAFLEDEELRDKVLEMHAKHVKA